VKNIAAGASEIERKRGLDHGRHDLGLQRRAGEDAAVPGRRYIRRPVNAVSIRIAYGGSRIKLVLSGAVSPCRI
jgi:hypothetical protein